MVSPAPRSTLFPYTTLFRSQNIPTGGAHGQIRQRCKQAGRIGDAAEEERDVEEQLGPESHQSEAGDRDRAERGTRERRERDRKSKRLNSSHSQISYAVYCLK